MSNLLFKRIRICSEMEQAGVTQDFSPRKTLLWGGNGAAKSTILKSLYRAFDAEPQGELPYWDYDAIVAVDFSTQNGEFTAVRKGDLRALYRDHEFYGAAATSAQWNEIFAETVGFNLMLLDRGGTFRRAAPSNFFLPFFVNQDGSFGPGWETFKSLKQFQNSVEHTLEYFVRVRPSQYFKLKANVQLEKSKQDVLKVEIATLQRTRARMRRNQNGPRIRLSAQQFQLEIKSLTELINTLSEKQNILRKQIVEHQELATALQDQINLSNAALKEHTADFKFASDASLEERSFVCPTCHAEHDSSFHTLLGLAEDARHLLKLKLMLEVELDGVHSRLNRYRRNATDLRVQYAEAQQLLQTKKGRFTFGDFIKSYSASAADSQLAAEQSTTQKELDDSTNRINDLNVDLAAISRDHDTKVPIAAFRERFGAACTKLNVPRPEGLDKWKLNKRPIESGSRNARALVAYYSALWNSIAINGRLPAPLIIDSPNQGAQDRINLKQLLAVVASSAPDHAQVVLAHEEVPINFDADLIVPLDNTKRLLTSEGFSEVAPELFRYVETARAYLAGVESLQYGLNDSLEHLDD